MYLSYDVDRIGDYVFGAVSPTEVSGASRILEDYSKRARHIVEGKGGATVFSGGGSGLFRMTDPGSVTAVAQDLDRTLRDETAGAASVTVVDVAASERFADTWRSLQRRMRDAKLAKATDDPCAVLVPPGTDPRELCESCGRELATHEDGGVRLGDQCRIRRDYGRRDRSPVDGEAWVEATRELERLIDDREREIAAAVYLDADRMGDRLGAISTEDELRQLSEGLRDGCKAAVTGAVGELGLEGRVVTPVVGGDDVLVITSASRALDVLGALRRHLDQRLGSLPGGAVPMSAGVAFGPLRAPLRVLFEHAKDALRAAKRASAVVAEPHAAFTSFASMAGHVPGTLLLGGAVPASRLAALETAVAAVEKVGTTQRSGIRTDLAEPSPLVRALALDYRGARNPPVAALLRSAERVPVTGADGAADHRSILLGLLALHGLTGGGRR